MSLFGDGQPSFMKIILKDPHDFDSRNIPANFKEIIVGGKFPCTICLKTYCAGECMVLVREDVFGEMTILEGWKDFVARNMIKPNDLLIFQYKGNFSFHVQLFYPHGLEKLSIHHEIKDDGTSSGTSTQGRKRTVSQKLLDRAVDDEQIKRKWSDHKGCSNKNCY